MKKLIILSNMKTNIFSSMFCESKGISKVRRGAMIEQINQILWGSENPQIKPELFKRWCQAEYGEDLYGIIISLAPDFTHEYAVLSFLYSVLATCKSFNDMLQISLDTGTLIDPTFGHSGQCLLNLLITGCMTPEVINGDFNLGGFIIRGITSQPDIGFLSIIEATMHCEVGWFLKNPAFPIWVIGSESHYTVLASTCRELVRKDEASSSQKASLTKAEIEFTSMCPAGDESGFFAIDRLPELLQKLNIVLSDTEYEDVKRELDPEELGLVLRNVFLNKFYPAEMAERRTVKIKFPLYHFNSLPLSNPEGRVNAIHGNAELVDPEEELQNPSLTAPNSEVTDMLRCLRTKWPTIRIQWNLENRSKYPSLH
ncbi:hypothetical protein Ciccas_009242 [Cichlidogyrus casuarinus]|uniref:Ubiquitin carboxyl-terminal hydrolase MINDY n=1 Tax=Cichlidogyrus casuarinus TaxID=1844966 RepID=A0ABD2PXT9_9PLAT